MARPAPKALSPEEFDRLTSVWQAPGLIATLVSVFAAFGGWALLLPVIPLAIIDSGGSEGLAGLSTGIFMAATVITQAFTPRILRRLGYFTVMAGAGLLLGLPTLLHIFTLDSWAIVLVAIIRGIGFGSVTVAESALVADLVPYRLLGRSSAVFGGFVGAAQLIGFPLGMWVFDQFGAGATFGLAAVYALVGFCSAFGLPNMQREGSPGQAPVEEAEYKTTSVHTEKQKVGTWKLATVPGILVGTAAVGFASFSTFLAPAAASIDAVAAATISGFTLAVVGGAQMIARMFTGWWADRKGEPGTLAPLGLMSCFIGVIAAAITIIAAPEGGLLAVCCLVAAALFGLGFGVAQSDALLMMFQRLPRDRSAEASALWNMTFDSGTGIGAMVLGVVAGVFAFQGAFFGAAIVIAFGFAVVITDRVLGRHRISDYDNVRLRLRRVGARVRVRRMGRTK